MPTFSEQAVEIHTPQLFNACQGQLFPNTTSVGSGKSETTTLDDNGNAFVVALAGPSCAPGRTLVQADLVGPPYTTLTTQFTIHSPCVT